jgi:fatty-acyl-CoA synthase
MADTLQQLLREPADQHTVAIKYGDRSWTWAEHVVDASAQAAALIAAADPARPLHVGALMGNTPDMPTALAAAALFGYVLCGINTTRRGDALARDIARVDTQVLLTDAEHRHLLDGLQLPGVAVIDVSTTQWASTSGQAPLTPDREAAPDDTFMMIFTSGTSGEPKAVEVPHSTVLFSGGALVQRYGLTSDDVCYLATPEQPDDHDNPLRIAFGNEAADRDIEAFGRRFGCTVWDGFGSTETAVIITRPDDCPAGSIGKGFPGVAIYHADTVTECDVAVFDDTGALVNAEAATGELVNTAGSGLFRGYYNDPGATDQRLRHGMYWSGDLAYRDADGWIYLAGRTADWMRVDGENLTAAPIERILLRLPAINRVAVYPVPDEYVGDKVMAAVVLQDDAVLTPEDFGQFLAAQPDLSPKAWPRFVWIADDLPTTATNKILKRDLVVRGADPDGRTVWRRDGTRFHPCVSRNTRRSPCV